MNNTCGALLLLAALVAGIGYAQEGEDTERDAEEVALDPNAPPASEAACFNVRTINNFDALSNEHIYAQAGPNRHYLLTVDRVCFGLRNAQSIIIENNISRVCSNSVARVFYRGIGGRLESCFIRAVESVEDRSAAQALAEIRSVRRR